jgi:hypothetical protein
MFVKRAIIQTVSVIDSYRMLYRNRKIANKIDLDNIVLKDLLEAVSDMYKISTDLNDYMFIVQRALTANVPNKNMDAFEDTELLDLKDDGRFTYETFIGVPLLREHRDTEIDKAGGVVIGVYFDDENEYDKPVITLGALDTKKWSDVAYLLKQGSRIGFSMGCVVEKTVCSVCGNEAKTESQFCEHIRQKFGAWYGKAWEWCRGVWYKELSYVRQPADEKALLYGVCSLDGNCREY